MQLHIVLLSTLLGTAYSQLKCYDCNPEEAGNCRRPVEHNVKLTTCPAGLSSPKDVDYECFSLYLDDNNRGIYRGCAQKSAAVVDICEDLAKKYGNVTGCHTCTENSCNVQDVSPNTPPLRCYDCEANSLGHCYKPIENNVKVVNCPAKVGSLDQAAKEITDNNVLEIIRRYPNITDFECFELYFEGEKTGVYRGCAPRAPTVLSSCESLKEVLGEESVIRCKSCTTNECNSNDVSGVATVAVSKCVLLLSLVLCFFTLEF